MIRLKDVLTNNIELVNYRKEYVDKLFDKLTDQTLIKNVSLQEQAKKLTPAEINTLLSAEEQAEISKGKSPQDAEEAIQYQASLKQLKVYSDSLRQLEADSAAYVEQHGQEAYNETKNNLSNVIAADPKESGYFDENGVKQTVDSDTATIISWITMGLGIIVATNLGIPAFIAWFMRAIGRGGSRVAKGSQAVFKGSSRFWLKTAATVTVLPLFFRFVRVTFYGPARRKFIRNAFLGNLAAAAKGYSVGGIKLAEQEIQLAQSLLRCMDASLQKGMPAMIRLEKMLVEQGAKQVYKTMKTMTTAYIEKNGTVSAQKFVFLEQGLANMLTRIVKEESEDASKLYVVFTEEYVETQLRLILRDVSETNADTEARINAIMNKVFQTNREAALQRVNATNWQDVIVANNQNRLYAAGFTDADLRIAQGYEASARQAAEQSTRYTSQLGDILNRLEQGQSQRLTRADLDAAFAAQRGGQRGGQSSHPNYDNIAELPWGHPQRKGGDRQAAFVNGLSSTEKNIFNDVFMNWERYSSNGTRTRYMDELYKKSVFPDIGKWYNTYHRTAGPWKTLGRDKAIKSKAVKQFYQEDKMLWYINNLTY